MAFSLSAATRRMSIQFSLTSPRLLGASSCWARRHHPHEGTAGGAISSLLFWQNSHHNHRSSHCRLFSDYVASSSNLSPETTGIEPTLTQPTLHKSPDGRQFAAFELPKFHQKLKPYIVKRRLKRMRTYIGQEKGIRGSPWRLNLVCQLAAGLTLNDSLTQLDFCEKRVAPLVQKVLKRTANLAEIKDGLQRSQLEVAECFATRGSPLKRNMVMGRGRSGRMEHKYGHFRVVLREIDFKLRIYQAPSINQKKKWFVRQQDATADAQKAAGERAEMEELKRQAEANRAKREADEASRK
jgi:large subunit ribosomal protein L22